MLLALWEGKDVSLRIYRVTRKFIRKKYQKDLGMLLNKIPIRTALLVFEILEQWLVRNSSLTFL